jgi:hypothetical protein
MIQRIQTVYMLLALLLVGFGFIVPLWYFGADGMVERIQGFQHVLQAGSTWVMIDDIRKTQFFFAHSDLLRMIAHTTAVSLGVINFLLLIWMIFAYKKRKRQIAIGRTVVIFVMLQILAYVYLSLQPPVFLERVAAQRADYGLAFPALTLIFVWLANRGVRKDEALVRSVDRIR